MSTKPKVKKKRRKGLIDALPGRGVQVISAVYWITTASHCHCNARGPGTLRGICLALSKHDNNKKQAAHRTAGTSPTTSTSEHSADPTIAVVKLQKAAGTDINGSEFDYWTRSSSQSEARSQKSEAKTQNPEARLQQPGPLSGLTLASLRLSHHPQQEVHHYRPDIYPPCQPSQDKRCCDHTQSRVPDLHPRRRVPPSRLGPDMPSTRCIFGGLCFLPPAFVSPLSREKRYLPPTSP